MRSRKPTHPGEVLLEDVIKPLGITITDAAKDLGISRKTLSELVNGKCALSPELAVRIGKATNTSPESWLAMQTKLDCLWQIYVKDALSETRRKHGNPKPIDLKGIFKQPVKLQIAKACLCNRHRTPTDADLVLKIERDVGQDLAKIAEENNLPYRVVLGTALLIAKDLGEHQKQ